jgi:Tfp pilus assembly protein PilF
MAEPKYHRIALAQISFNPAYLDESGVSYLHEPVFPGDDEHGFYKLGGQAEVHDLRARIATAFIEHMAHKIRAIIRFASRERVELIVLPEYSVPVEILDLCMTLAHEENIVIIAGSHIATKHAINEHSRLGIAQTGIESRFGRAVCPVFLPSGQSFLFEKVNRSKWESSLPAGAPSAPIQVQLGKEPVHIEVLICLDALQEGAGRKASRAKGAPTLVAMPSLTPSVELFYKRAELLLATGKVTLFANIADFGGSRAFARADRAKGWLVLPGGVDSIQKHSEAVVILDADLSSQFEVRKSTSEHFPVREVSITPLIYGRHSPACKEFLSLVQSLQGEFDPDAMGLSEVLKRFIAMDYRLFPQIMQEKLKDFLAHVVEPGLADESAWRKALTPVGIETTTSTDLLRWDLCGKSIELINELTLSGKYPEKTDQMMATYKYLVNKRNELRARLELPSPRRAASAVVSSEDSQPLSASIPPFEPPFYDREPILSAIQRFIDSTDKACLIVAGMRGIGKTAIAREVFKKVVPPTWKRMRIPLTEGASYPRLLAELAHLSGLRLPGESALDSSAKMIDLAQNVLLNFSHAPRLTLVFDDFQYLLQPNGEFADENTGKFVSQLIEIANGKRNKILMLSTIVPKFDPDTRSFTEAKHITGLEKKDAENLFAYWFRFEREDLSGHPLTYPERLLNVLSGHPLGVKVAAQLVAERTVDRVESETSLFKRLREAIIAFFLDHVSLSAGEDELIRFASIFRLPVDRDAFVTWKADRGAFLLDSLIGRSLIETDGEKYSLHPIVRDHFYTTTSLEILRPFHKMAGSYFLDRYKKAKSTTTGADPDLLAEAIHHFLCAGDRDKVKSFSLYKHELRPVAQMHYRRHEFNLAQRDYRLLISLDPTDFDAHFHLALIYAKNRQWDQAEEHFGKAMSLKSNAYWILQGYANAKLANNQLAEAEHLLLQALEINPRHSPTLTDLGRLHERQGDEAAAEAFFKDAVDADPNNSYAYVTYARFLLRARRYQEGLEFALAALETNPNDPRNKSLVRELRERVTAAGGVPHSAGDITQPREGKST